MAVDYPLAGISVFVVDDDDAARDSFVSLLESHDVSVRAFAGADDLLSELDQLDDGCFIIDVSLGGQNGIDVLDTVRNARPQAPAIITSGNAMHLNDEQLIALRCSAFLLKPFEELSLIKAILSAIAAPLPDQPLVPDGR